MLGGVELKAAAMLAMSSDVGMSETRDVNAAAMIWCNQVGCLVLAARDDEGVKGS